MSVDTSSHEFLLLLRQFEKGQAVLFAGAGFSLGAKNQRGEEPPDAPTLASRLAAECGWPYGGEDLPVVFAQAESHLGTAGLRSFLSSLYANTSPASWQHDVAGLHWHRIYTTNIDDVLERAYLKESVQTLSLIVCPAPFAEADQWYASVQCVHLHGSVLDSTKPLTFTLESFGDQTAVANPWYQQLIEDMQSKSVVFVGAKAEEFFAALVPRVRSVVTSNIDIIRSRYPHLVAAIAAGVLSSHSELLRDFEFVSVVETGADPAPRSMFLLGAEPTWADIAYNVDAPRGIAKRVQEALSDSPKGSMCSHSWDPLGLGKAPVCVELPTNLHAMGTQRTSLKV